MKALMIAGDRSGSGKTSVTLAIASILSRSMAVQTFKVGMDYIDPSYLSAVTGRACRNLDTFVMSPDQVQSVFANGCRGADIALIEGVRGLYEGAEALDDSGSSASVARILDVPVILVVNARSITRSAAAIVRGFQTFDPSIRIAGVILNNVAGEKHAEKAGKAIEHYCGVPVLGSVPRNQELELGMRHLGLVPFREGQEVRGFRERIETVTEVVRQAVDINGLLAMTREVCLPEGEIPWFSRTNEKDIRVGIAYDHVFNFYYADLFDILEALGSEIVFFSPASGDLPDADGYIIGGGYPEMHASALAENQNMLEEIRKRSEDGTPLYAECGGLMYLTRELVLKEGWQGRKAEERYPLSGVFPGKTVMPARRVVAYVTGESSAGSPMGASLFKGHEFHYSAVVLPHDTHFAYRLSRGQGIRDGLDGALVRKTLGSFSHLHPVGSHAMFRRFLETCRLSRGE
jgi:cobyrinic acid a,c-diamide synthase